ncbi:MAG: IgGFc-binding protein [Polyangiaceae bacterium]
MPWLRFWGVLVTFSFIVVACGSRTDLPYPLPSTTSEAGDGMTEASDAPQDSDAKDGDARADADADADARDGDGPIIEGGPIDAPLDCDAGPVCNPDDPGYVYQCGARVFQCSSLETCKDGRCVNPCQDTLGQDTSNGCEFYAVQMDTVPEAEGVCFAVFVVNQWATGEPARIEVSRNGTVLPIEQFARIPTGTGTGLTYAPYVQSQGLAKDQVAVLFLSRDPAAALDPDPAAPRRLAGCPAGVTPAVVGDAAIHGTGKGGRAFHIKTNVPVVAYQMLPFGAGRARVTGATLLLPTNVWDQNYVVANAYAAPPLITELRAGPTTAIVAQADGTQVRVKPTVAIGAGGGLAGTAANTPVTYTLAKGEYLQITQLAELTGSAVEASAPVAVVGGSTLMDIPLDRVRADGAHQMLPPVHALGSEYVGVRYRGRRLPGGGTESEPVPWRIVGVVDGTKLTFDPPVAGAPASVNARQLVEWNATGPFVVKSQDAAHPFYFAQYMTGGQPFDGEGDPEFVNVIPPKQHLPRYTFFTDPTYPETNLVLVRQRVPTEAGLAFPDVTLDCAGVVGGWQTIGASGYQFTRVDLSTGDFQGVGGCDNGVHTITATVGGAAVTSPAFGLTVWGWGNGITYVPDSTPQDEANPKFTRWVSYGYPAGANLGRLNDVTLSAQ